MEIMKLQTRLSFHFVNRKDNPRTNLLMEVKSNQIKSKEAITSESLTVVQKQSQIYTNEKILVYAKY